MALIDAFSEEEQALIRTEPDTLTPSERAHRWLLFIRPIRAPFKPGTPMLTDALVLAGYGARGAGDAFAKVLQLVHEGDVDFSGYGGTWSVARASMNIILQHLQQTDLAIPPRARVNRVNFAELLFRNFDGFSPQEWQGFGPNDLDEITARFIEIRAPEEIEVVPTSVRNRLPQIGRPTIHIHEAPPQPTIVRPHIEIPPAPPGPSAKEIAEAVGAEVGKRIEPLPGAIEAAFIRALARGQAFIPPVAPPPAPAPPARAPEGVTPVAPTVPPTPPPEGVTAPSEALGGTVQRSLTGEVVRPRGVTLTPVELAERQLADKYRPLFLDQVLGNEDTVGVLRAAASTDFLPLYLVTGPPGIGKTSAVLAAIRDYLLRVEAATGVRYFDPEYRVESATFGIDPQVLHYENADVVVRRGGVPALLGRISEFQRTGRLVTQARKFFILDDFTKFTEDQQNVLLPLGEKYPRSTVFFVANTPSYIPALESRAKVLRFKSPPEELIIARLLEIMRNEGMTFPDPVDVAQRIVSSLGFQKEFRKAVIELASAWAVFQHTGALP
jgi:hypothetical protein